MFRIGFREWLRDKEGGGSGGEADVGSNGLVGDGVTDDSKALQGLFAGPDGAGGDKGTEGEGGETEGGETEGEGGEQSGPYTPDAMPDGMLGKTDQETIDNLLKSNKGLQGKLSKKGREARAPEKAEDYTIGPANDDDTLGKQLAGDDMKPTLDVARDAAKAADMSQEQFDRFVRTFVENGVDPADLLSDEEASKLSYEAEKEALGELVGADRAQGVMDTISATGQRLVDNGVFTENDFTEFKIAAGTAEGALAIHKMIQALTGKKSIPVTLDNIEAGAVSAEDAYAMQAAMLKMDEGPEKEAERIKVAAAFKKAFPGDGKGSSPNMDTRISS